MAKLYTVFNLKGGHIAMPSGGYLEGKGAPEGRDRAYPVEIPEGHILWRLAKPPDADIRIVEGDARNEVEKPAPKPEPPAETPPPEPPAPATAALNIDAPPPPTPSVEAGALESPGVPEETEESGGSEEAEEDPDILPAPEVEAEPAPDMSGVLAGLNQDVASESDSEEGPQSSPRNGRRKGRR